MTRVLRIASFLLIVSACHSSQSPKPLSIDITPGTATIDIGGTQKFKATVTNGSDSDISWSLSGDGCANNACGWIDGSGMYSAPDDPPNPPTVTVTATAQAGDTKSASASVTITALTNTGFSGRYALLFNGFEADDVAVAISGSISSDGNGRITGGVLDANRTVGVQNIPVTGGSYSFGADARGRMVLNTPQGALAFRFAMNAPNPPNHTGRLICFQPGDSSRITGAGVIKKQTPAAFSLTALSGDFATGMLGEIAARTPVGVAGRFTLNGPLVGSGFADINWTGTPFAATPIAGNFVSIDGTTGRGRARLSFPNSFGDLDFAFYVVSASESFFISTSPRSDSVPLLSGPMLKQTDRPFTASSLAGPLVFNATGLTAAGSDVTIGRLDASASSGTIAGNLDHNGAGVISANVAFAGEYVVAADGRGALTMRDGATTTRYALYMVSRNSAFLLQSESIETASGWIEPQSGAPFSNTSFLGNYVVGTITPAECGCTSTSGVVTLNGADGTFLGARDKSKPDGLIPRDLWAGTFDVPPGTSGRGFLTTVLPSSESSVLYAVSPNKVLLINADSGFSESAVTVLENTRTAVER